MLKELDPRKRLEEEGSFLECLGVLGEKISNGVSALKDKVESLFETEEKREEVKKSEEFQRIIDLLSADSKFKNAGWLPVEQRILAFLKVDKCFKSLDDLSSFCQKHSLSMDQVLTFVQRIKESELPSSIISKLSCAEVREILVWECDKFGKIPNLELLNLNGYVDIVDVKSIATQVNRMCAEVTDLLQQLKRADFVKCDIAELVKDDYLALFDCLKINKDANQSSLAIYEQMPVLLRSQVDVWLNKVFRSAYGDTGGTSWTLGEKLKYFTELASEKVPVILSLALRCLQFVFLQYGVVLPEPRLIYLVSIWAVMASCMTAYDKHNIVELGAAIIAVVVSILRPLLKGELDDVSRLLAKDAAAEWEGISIYKKGRLNDEIKDMIDSWRNTLGVLVGKSLTLNNAARMLITYSFGTSYIRFVSHSMHLNTLFDSISPFPTKYSLHNIIKLYGTSEEFKRGDFYTQTSYGYKRYYHSSLTEELKRQIKINVTSLLPKSAPVSQGEIIVGMLDAEDIFAEETKRASFKASLRDDKQVELYARLAAHVYGDYPYAKPVDCKVLQKRETHNGMRAIVYQRGNHDIICAFAGTKTLKDWLHNFAQAKGLSLQYYDAKNFGGEVCKRYADKNIVFVGHSQGGGEAAFCAAAYSKAAYTFNPAGISDDTLSYSGLSSTDTNYKIHSYVFRGDVLNVLQDICEGIGFLDIYADGVRYDVIDYSPRDHSIDEIHGMKGILRYFGVQENYSQPNMEEYSVNIKSVNKRLLINDTYEYNCNVYFRGEVIGQPISVGDEIMICRGDVDIYQCVVHDIVKNGQHCECAEKWSEVNVIVKPCSLSKLF